jgi:hypothetical protein
MLEYPKFKLHAAYSKWKIGERTDNEPHYYYADQFDDNEPSPD